MEYLLDTNTCIYIIKKKPIEVLERFQIINKIEDYRLEKKLRSHWYQYVDRIQLLGKVAIPSSAGRENFQPRYAS